MDKVGSVEIVIKGGRPWGFTLQGGIESKSALTVAQLEPGGKAERHGGLKPGDHVLRINDVQCLSLSDATQLIECAFRTLTVLVWRSKSVVGLTPQLVRETVKYSEPRGYRPIREDRQVIRRTSTTSSKDLPRLLPKDSVRCKLQKSPLQSSSSPEITLTCDSHQGLELADFGSPRDRSPLHSSCHSLVLSRSNSVISNTDSEKEVVFQTHDNITRYTRSPRNLTKDSGYETSAQTEHDYANVEWVNRIPTVSPADYTVPKDCTSTIDSPRQLVQQTGRPSAMCNYCPDSDSERSNKYNNERYHSVDAKSHLGYCSHYNEAGVTSVAAVFNKRTGSCSSVYSSSESLSSRCSKADIRPARSSLSLVSKSVKQGSVPPYVQQDCQYLSRLVSPAQSVPNLNYKDEMASRKFNKKLSVYEELACKSGFDFSPLVQRQSFWAQKQAFENNRLGKNSENVHSYQIGDKSAKSEKISKNKPIPRNYFSSGPNTSNESHNRSSNISSPTPPVPTRDSSLHYLGNSTHEKFPSWPVSGRVEMDRAAAQPSGYRSNSWTEHTECTKDCSGAYSRPKTHFQISTQQLPPVQEKAKGTVRRNPSSTSEKDLPSENILSERKVLDARAFECIYQNTQEVFYPNERQYDSHSPPEKDVNLLEKAANKQIRPNVNIRQYENTPRPLNQCGMHVNLQATQSMNELNSSSSNTPLLDRLRLEKESFPSSWVQQPENDTCSEAGTCISSNSSSQETLKWYGSYSDLSTSNTRTRNESPAYDSDNSTIYEELGPRSVDEEIKPCSDLHNSTTEFLTGDSENCSQNLQSLSSEAIHHSDIQKEKHTITYPRNESIPHAQKNEGRHAKCPTVSSHSLYENVFADSGKISFTSEHCNRSLEQFDQKVSGSKPITNVDVNNANIGASSRISTETEVVIPQTARNSISDKGSNQQDTLAYSRNNTPQRHKSFSHELKAIQKQAVLSFYHRQRSIDAKDSTERKAPRSSSFSFTHENVNAPADQVVPLPAARVPQIQMKRSLSSSSFSSQNSVCSRNAQQWNPAASPTSNTKLSSSSASSPGPSPECPRVPSSSSLSTDDNLKDCNISVQGTIESTSNQRDARNIVLCQANDLTKDVETGLDYSYPDKPLKKPFTARKAYVKRNSSPNENVIVKVLSSHGVCLEPEKKEPRKAYPNAKPQLPPKRIHKDKFPWANSHHINSEPLHSVPTEKAEDDELKLIENNALKISSSYLAKPITTFSPSPELPLPPPPPINIDIEISSNDDPFPPPPDLQELASFHANQSSHHFSSPGASSIPAHFTYHISDPQSININNNAHDSQIVFMKTSPNKEDIFLSHDSSPTLCSSPDICYQNELILDKIEKQGEVEAIYANLDFRKNYENISACKIHKSYTAPSVVNVTHSATQTSEATPSLQRKAYLLLTRSSDKIDIFEDRLLSSPICKMNLTSAQPDFKGNCTKESIDQNTKVANPQTVAKLLKSQHAIKEETVNNKSDVLPPTNPYFTTSEPKAKLLNRYSHQSLDKPSSDQIELKGQKEELITSISKKLNILRLEEIELKEETRQNEELGLEVTAQIEKLAKPNEVQKYRVHVEELEKILNLLLSLSGRLARAENALSVLPDNPKPDEKIMLEAKRNKLSQQHDEAWHLKENIDRRSSQVSLFLHQYLTKEEYADYEHFIKMKSKLLMDAREVDEKIKLGEEQLAALHGTFQALYTNGEPGGNQNADIPATKFLTKA